MARPTFHYDEPSDTLYISFAPGEKATGLELNEHVLLRVDRQSRRAVGLTLFDYSLLAQETETGPRSFPLDGLGELPAELRELAFELLRSSPVDDFLALSTYTPTVPESVPIISLRPLPEAAEA